MSSEVLFVLAVYVVVLVTPGPNVVVVTELAARGEKVAALFTGFGFGFGASVLALTTVSGLASLILVAPVAKTALTLVAAGILIWLGISTWLDARREAAEAAVEFGSSGSPATDDSAPFMTTAQRRAAAAFFHGLAFNVTNPKAIAFFIGVYGGPMTQAPAIVLFLVVATCLALEVVWYVSVTSMFSTVPVRRFYARHRGFIGRFAGLCMIAFGTGVAAFAARPEEGFGL
jgi:threonine efflux protein